MGDEGQSYDRAALSGLLHDAFTATELRRFCLERPAFAEIPDDFGPGFSFNEMIDATLSYCARRRLFPELLAEIERYNPRQYDRYRERLGLAAPPASRQPEPVPPRQPALARAWAGLAAWARRQRGAPQIGLRLLLAGAVVAAVILAVSFFRRQEPEYWAREFRGTNNANRRVTCLAEIIRRGGGPDTVQSLFFEELKEKPEEQLAMFRIDPKGMEDELTLVVEALYTRLENDPHGNALLQAMADALAPASLQSSKAMKLSLEIEQWQAGRTRYAAGDYWGAIRAYTLALSQNDRNPATYLERAQAYVGIIAYRQALDDLQQAYLLDSRRRAQIREIIAGDPGLLAYLWRHRSDYFVLLSGVPTLTPTPRPTRTPTFTPTPRPTRTPTRTPAPAASPPATPTPAAQALFIEVNSAGFAVRG